MYSRKPATASARFVLVLSRYTDHDGREAEPSRGAPTSAATEALGPASRESAAEDCATVGNQRPRKADAYAAHERSAARRTTSRAFEVDAQRPSESTPKHVHMTTRFVRETRPPRPERPRLRGLTRE